MAHRLRMPLLAAALCVLAATSCSGNSAEPVGLDATDPPSTVADDSTPEPEHGEPTKGGERTQSADTTETAPPDNAGEMSLGGQTHEFPEAGLTIVEPDEIPEEAAQAVAVYIEYLRERRTAQREVEFDERIEDLAYPALAESLESSIDYQAENGLRYSGELVVHLEVEHSDEIYVLLGGCLDGTDLTYIDDEGEHAIRGAQGNATAVISATVDAQLGEWMVSDDLIEDDTPC
ncbi:hypothetical protein [Phytoactinopolyspora mesophila]|uniref:Lipoprotein n=1 Tax=Phytoactinopolyspora mesophila TaxID=2650750 RepID=A0A7K3M4Q5_9ACTN|nr:hypothetical protein [Phytoactinopolyspora mesophila]NDL58017.1 hypothetical protein [Phytoactinopolyspora mesophila]